MRDGSRAGLLSLWLVSRREASAKGHTIHLVTEGDVCASESCSALDSPAGEGRRTHSFLWRIWSREFSPSWLLPPQRRKACLALTSVGGLTEQSWAPISSTAHEGEREAQSKEKLYKENDANKVAMSQKVEYTF